MVEEWRDIYFEEDGVEYDYRGLYQVSNIGGRVKSLNYNKTGKEKILKPIKDNGGYLQICLCKNGKKKKFLIHRLVAHLFIENDDPEHKTEINHIDEDKENNSASNLEWVTPKENINHGTRNERVGRALSKKVIGFSLTDTKVIVFKSTRQGEKFGFDHGAICNCCNGKLRQYKGYKWYYLDDIKK